MRRRRQDKIGIIVVLVMCIFILSCIIIDMRSKLVALEQLPNVETIKNDIINEFTDNMIIHAKASDNNNDFKVTNLVINTKSNKAVSKNTSDDEKSYIKTHPYTEDEIYELAKIIMCEAEGESQKCKEYVGQVVLNRVESDKFPDTIHSVIFQNKQFSPTFDGRWEKVEPNEDCYNAAYTVINALEPLTEALYFEACNGNSWHSNNLIEVAEIDNTRFYIE